MRINDPQTGKEITGANLYLCFTPAGHTYYATGNTPPRDVRDPRPSGRRLARGALPPEHGGVRGRGHGRRHGGDVPGGRHGHRELDQRHSHGLDPPQRRHAHHEPVMRKTPHSHEAGYTAIEIMLSIAVGIGAAGVMTMQSASVPRNADAHMLDVANAIAREWIERLRRDGVTWTVPANPTIRPRRRTDEHQRPSSISQIGTVAAANGPGSTSNWIWPDAPRQRAPNQTATPTRDTAGRSTSSAATSPSRARRSRASSSARTFAVTGSCRTSSFARRSASTGLRAAASRRRRPRSAQDGGKT